MMKRAAGGRVVWFPFATCLQVDVVYIYIYIYISLSMWWKRMKNKPKSSIELIMFAHQLSTCIHHGPMTY
jgi:tryptophan-rich sensory protein